MRTIERTTRFKKDWKRTMKGERPKVIRDRFREVVEVLANDEPLPAARRDHALSGEYGDCRECHLLPDVLLIYRKPDAETLQLVRIGSHAELFE